MKGIEAALKAFEPVVKANRRTVSVGMVPPGEIRVYMEAAISAYLAAEGAVMVPVAMIAQLKDIVDDGQIGDAERFMDRLCRTFIEHAPGCALRTAPAWAPADCTCGALAAAPKEG